jgi:hypothetical protein
LSIETPVEHWILCRADFQRSSFASQSGHDLLLSYGLELEDEDEDDEDEEDDAEDEDAVDDEDDEDDEDEDEDEEISDKLLELELLSIIVPAMNTSTLAGPDAFSFVITTVSALAFVMVQPVSVFSSISVPLYGT